MEVLKPRSLTSNSTLRKFIHSQFLLQSAADTKKTSPLQPLCSFLDVSTGFHRGSSVANLDNRHVFTLLDDLEVDTFRRIKFLVFDAKSLDGMDASGAMSMLKLSRKARCCCFWLVGWLVGWFVCLFVCFLFCWKGWERVGKGPL